MRARLWLLPVLAIAACDPPHAPKGGVRVAGTPLPVSVMERALEPEPEIELVVLIVVDQLPSWTFTEDLKRLDGGLARMARTGYYAPYAQIPYATTATAPGHAAIASGAPPSVTGILDNSWYRRERGATATVTIDPRYPILSARGPADPGGASPLDLPVQSVADRVTAAGGLAVSIGAKQRAALLVGGRDATLAVFYDADQAAMTTSRYYADELPPWLVAVNETHVEPYLSRSWEPLDPSLYATLCGPDHGPGEGVFYGLDQTFPHDLRAVEAPGKALQATPFIDELVLDTATAALDGAGLGTEEGRTDLLILTLAGHDYAGHVWGQESWERRDLLERLDDRLGQFFAELDRRHGNAYRVVLTSDHGATPTVERSLDAELPAHRTDMRALIGTANKAAEGVLGPGTWALGWWANAIYVSDTLLAQDEKRRTEALDAMVEAVSRVPGIGYVARTDLISGDCARLDTADDRLACRAVSPGASGEIFCTMAPYSVPLLDYSTGTAHDSPSPEDRIVPIMMMGPGIEPQVEPNAVSLLSIAPTVAQLLGVEAPESARAPSLLPTR